MIEESVKILSVEEGGLWVEGISRSACQSCSVRQGCGQNLLSSTRAVRLFVPFYACDASTFSAGDFVTIGVREGLLVRGALLIYLLPICTMLGGLWLGENLYRGDGAAVLGAISGLLGGGFLIRRLFGLKCRDAKIYPCLIEDH